MTRNLYAASRQWAERPDDERFETIEDMALACERDRDGSVVSNLALRDIRFAAHDDEVLVVVGEHENVARMTNYAFGQVARSVGAPADYLRTLSARAAANCLTESHGRAASSRDWDLGRQRQLLFNQEGSDLVLRGETSTRYARIWNADVVGGGLRRLRDNGWVVPPARPARPDQRGTRPATADDILAMGAHATLGVRVGDPIAPAGLYASAHDLFAFMVDPVRRITSRTSPHGLSRGVFVTNSEVGAGAFSLTCFLFDAVCGNHIVWGVEQSIEFRVIHTGNAATRWRELEAAATTYLHSGAEDDAAKIIAAQTTRLGDDVDAIVERLHARKIPKALTESAYQAAFVAPEAGDPLSVWGIVQGMTRVSQRTMHADERVRIDRAAGRVLQMAF